MAASPWGFLRAGQPVKCSTYTHCNCPDQQSELLQSGLLRSNSRASLLRTIGLGNLVQGVNHDKCEGIPTNRRGCA